MLIYLTASKTNAVASRQWSLRRVCTAHVQIQAVYHSIVSLLIQKLLL